VALFQRAGIATWYEVQGDGPPLLLIPGLASDAASWGQVPARLAGENQVILMDNRGAGRTRAQGPVRIGELAGDALALMEHLGHERYRVLGHSMGGAVALHLAALAPGRVRRLVLAASFLVPSARNRVLFQDWAEALETASEPAAWYRNLFAWIFSASFFESPEGLAQAIQGALDHPFAPTPAQFRAQVEALAACQAPPGLGALATPTLVLAGADDILVPPAASRELAAALPGARFRELPGAAHALHLEQPEAFAAAVREFLA
jgi:pimeloyl-ACP methyl ester carboxylesterase